jgi:hypothetical protein
VTCWLPHTAEIANMVITSKNSDVTNTTSVDAHDDLLHEELDVPTTGNNNEIM